ncbi:PAS domain S-box protein [Desulfosporosinus sp. OT]|uniref:PAS domain S-box protein n=1 Tax=Desulfosporosinus sp. OT TaxID=913865 RepID=UPI0002239C08|nr:PAS domain S-box protein [Desulfosporosinus sp. OT]EGW36740.1 sensory box protein [Desulfosporosinus sp. OT]
MSTYEVISEVKKKVFFLETALAEAREDNEMWDRIFTENYWGMLISDVLTGQLIKVNSRYAEMLGYNAHELIGKSIYDVYAPEFHQKLPKIMRHIHERGHYAYKSAQMRKDGSSFPVHIDSYEVTIKERRLRVVSIWDITESERKEKELSQYRKNLEELVELRTNELVRINNQLRSEIAQKEAVEHKLAQTNQELINTLESISDGFLAVNRQREITYANQAFVEAQGNNIAGNIIGSDFEEFYQNGSKLIFDFCLQVMEDEKPARLETYAPLMGNWVEISAYPTESGISIFFRNIEERKKMEKAVEEEHQRLYTLFNSFPGLIYVQEENYKIRFANSRFRDKFGSWEGKRCYEVIAGLASPCDECVTSTVFESVRSLWIERLFENRIYEKFIQPFIDADGSRLIFKVLIDITDRKNADREMARLDRLNMVGEMAAGIAHEVRNPLTTVHGFLQLLAAKDSTKEYHEFYKLMIEELDRANLIITDFLSLASDKTSDFELINISVIVRSLFPLLSADALNKEKELYLELEQVPDTKGNENELRQLLLNLARNGLEAMQGGGRTLTIQTYKLGNHIILRVRDQGEGIDPMILEKLGTPFLTTKERGTGLGVAICQSIAARHNAVINYETNPGGTTVTVKFAVSNY